MKKSLFTINNKKINIKDIKVDTEFENKLPNPEGEEFNRLVSDIQKRGIIVDLIITKDKLLLDGHRRLKAAKSAGLTHVPVKVLDMNGQKSWQKAFAVAINLHRRHLNEVQRANLGSSLLRIERKKAKQRQIEGGRKGGKTTLKPETKEALENHYPELRIDRNRATEEVAKQIGISRKTFERIQAIRKKQPETIQKLVDGEISISAAYKEMKNTDLRESTTKETKQSNNGSIQNLQEVTRKYRTVYIDLSKIYNYSIKNKECGLQFRRLPIPDLGHPEGCHFWIWCTWKMISEEIPHQLFNLWKIPWKGVIIWDKKSTKKSKWLDDFTEVLILAVSKELPLQSEKGISLIKEKQRSLKKKPEKAYTLIEELSLPPMIELYTDTKRKDWDHWECKACKNFICKELK